ARHRKRLEPSQTARRGFRQRAGDWIETAGQGMRAVRGHGDALGEATEPREIRTLAHAPGRAFRAGAAAIRRLACDGGADQPLADAATDRTDDARVLVTEHQRWLVRKQPLRGVNVGSADPRGFDSDHDLARTGRGFGDLVDREPCAAAPGGDLHVNALLVVGRDEDAVTRPAIERLGQMALARRVLDENDLTRADLARLAVARGDLHAGVEVDDVLTPRRRMPVEIVVGLDLTEDHARGRKAFGRLARPAALGELDLDVAEMRFALRVDVEIVDSHARPPGGVVPDSTRGF